jgi:hypothetical protein
MNLGRVSVVIRRNDKKGARIGLSKGLQFLFSLLALSAGMFCFHEAVQLHSQYTVGWRSPLRIRFQSPLVIAHGTETADAKAVQRDSAFVPHAYQQYTCQKFGPACRVALAIQRSENPQGNGRSSLSAAQLFLF